MAKPLLSLSAAALALALAACSSTPSTNTPEGGSTTGTGSDGSTGAGETASTSGGGTASADEGTTEGKHAVDVKSATYIAGDGPKSIADAKGKVVILDFWGTYCKPCKDSFPKYQELVDKHKGDLVVIAVSTDDPDDKNADDLKEFASKLKAKFVILWDKDKSIAKKYNPSTFPTSFVIDKEGKISKIHSGFNPGDEKAIDADVSALLK
ncbi:MAG: TlpA disulfide reductase family protein [Polyangiaceae bacterium]